MGDASGASGALIIRPATTSDVNGISAVLVALKAAGKRRHRCDPAFVLTNYLEHPDQVSCLIALRGDNVLGFQSLKRATPANPYGTPVGWGIIGTHIHPDCARMGIGRGFAEQTLETARGLGVLPVEARVGTSNPAAYAYYSSIGFSQPEGGEDGILLYALDGARQG